VEKFNGEGAIVWVLK